MPNVREPKKVNSIDKKDRIIKAGLKLFGEVGYYNTNTAEIAKEAGVSTGIVYNYFFDKKDILKCAIELYFDQIFSQFQAAFKNVEIDKNYKTGDIFAQLIPAALKTHETDISLHKQMIGLSFLDDDVRSAFIECEKKMSEKIYEFASKLPINQNNLKSKAHLSFHFMEILINEIDYKGCDEETKETFTELGRRVFTSLFID